MDRVAVLDVVSELDFVSEYEQEWGKPMPSLNHSIVQSNLNYELRRRFGRDYTVLTELTLDMEPVATPDICVYSILSPNWLHDEIRKAQAPLLVVEILSPSQSVDEMIPKIERYFEAGVKSCWLVQPPLQQIAVFTPEMQPEVFTRGPVQDPASGFSVNIEDIFKA